MNPALLRGREHTSLGRVAAIAEGRCAIALSRGGAPKTYAHDDPNEDAAAFVVGEHGLLVAVADGHAGCVGSEIAIERLVQHHAPAWTELESHEVDALWPAAARAAILDLNERIREHEESRAPSASRTTLAFALIRPGEGLLHFASVGDSHVYRVDAGSAVDIARTPGEIPVFLGGLEATPGALAKSCVVGTSGLAEVRAVLLATDGISERGIGVEVPEAAVLESVERALRSERHLRPLEAARTAVELALSAHRRNRAGDNVASAVAWLAR